MTPAERIADSADEIERLRDEIPKLMDALEVAWGIIANGRAWDPAMHDEWEAAKFRFRDEHWNPALDRNLIDKTGGVS